MNQPSVELLRLYAQVAVREAVAKGDLSIHWLGWDAPDEPDPRPFFAHIRTHRGCWADAATPEAAVADLHEVIQGWVEVKYHFGDDDIPVVGGIDIYQAMREGWQVSPPQLALTA